MTGGQAAPHRLTTHPQPCAQSRCARTAEMRRPPRAWGVRALTAEPRVPATVGRCPACLSLPASQAGVQRCSASAVSRSGPDRRAHAAPPHAVHAKIKQSVMILAPLTPCSQPINVAPCVQSVSSAQNNNRLDTRAPTRTCSATHGSFAASWRASVWKRGRTSAPLCLDTPSPRSICAAICIEGRLRRRRGCTCTPRGSTLRARSVYDVCEEAATPSLAV